MFKKQEADDVANRYIRERVKQARIEASESQEDLAKKLEKSRVAISDLERGRVAVSAADLAMIAAYYEKPISYFYPARVTVNKDELSSLDEELLFLFSELPETQKHIALEYIRKQVEITSKAREREALDQLTEIKSESKRASITSVDIEKKNISSSKHKSPKR